MGDREIAATILILAGLCFTPLMVTANTKQPIQVEPTPTPTVAPTLTPTPTPVPFVATPTEEPTATPEPTVSEEAAVPKKLEKRRVTCYLPTGFSCADGTPPYHGAIATNMEHIGQGCRLYKEDGTMIGYFVSHDIGGHPDLVNGSAIDVFRYSMEDAWAFLYENCWVEGGQWYVWLEWEEDEHLPAAGASPQ